MIQFLLSVDYELFEKRHSLTKNAIDELSQTREHSATRLFVFSSELIR